MSSSVSRSGAWGIAFAVGVLAHFFRRRIVLPPEKRMTKLYSLFNNIGFYLNLLDLRASGGDKISESTMAFFRFL